MNLWKNYKSLLYKTFPDLKLESEWATWEGKGTNLTARTYTNPYFIKSREVDIWSDKSCIYNTIIYPKTGSNCLLYTSPSPRDKRQSRMPSSA